MCILADAPKKMGAASAPEGRRSKALEKARMLISIKHASSEHEALFAGGTLQSNC